MHAAANNGFLGIWNKLCPLSKAEISGSPHYHFKVAFRHIFSWIKSGAKINHSLILNVDDRYLQKPNPRMTSMTGRRSRYMITQSNAATESKQYSISINPISILTKYADKISPKCCCATFTFGRCIIPFLSYYHRIMKHFEQDACIWKILSSLICESCYM